MESQKPKQDRLEKLKSIKPKSNAEKRRIEQAIKELEEIRNRK